MPPLLKCRAEISKTKRFILTEIPKRYLGIWTEWKQPLEPLLETVAAFITADNAEWCVTPTELVSVLGVDMKANTLSMKMNINAGRLFNEYGICYENKRCHASERHMRIFRRRDGRVDVLDGSEKTVTIDTHRHG